MKTIGFSIALASLALIVGLLIANPVDWTTERCDICKTPAAGKLNRLLG